LSSLGFLIPTFGVHHVPSPKTTLNMPPRRSSQHQYPDEGTPQPTTTQTPPTITEASEDQTFDTIPKLQLQQINMPTMAAGTNQTGAVTPRGTVFANYLH
jgi:hypothetical protein